MYYLGVTIHAMHTCELMFKSLTAMGFHASQHVPLKLCPDHWLGNKTSTTHGSPSHRGTAPPGELNGWLSNTSVMP